MPEDFFASIGSKGEELVNDEDFATFGAKPDEQETDVPAESQTETVEEGEAPSHQGAEAETPADDSNTDGEDNVPLNKNPRFREVIEQNRKLQEKLSRLEEIEAKVSQLQSQKTEEKLPEWFTEAYGEDTNAWKVQQTVIKETAEKVKQEIMEGEQRRAQEQRERETRWNNYVTDSLTELETEGKKFDKNELLKITLEYQPTDANGNISLRKGYDLLQMKKQTEMQDKTAPKKAIAGMSSAPSKQAQPAERDYLTAADLRGKSFRDLI